MSEPFLGEIRIYGFNFAPRSWAACDGQLLPINQNQSLFSLLGTTYGGDGRTTFALPDLRGRAPMHEGSAYFLGRKSGEENHTLSLAETPAHTHGGRASAHAGNSPVPTNNFPGAANNLYRTADNLTALHAGTVANSGGSQAHNNMQPYLTLNFCIALQGLFPS